MKWLVKSTLLLLLTSCSAQWHLKKAVQKDPLILEKDTMVVTDTVVVQPVAITDTVTLKQHDTITIVKDKLKVSLIKVNDTIIINAECASDTIVRTIEIPYEKIVYVPQQTFKQRLEKYILMFLTILSVIFLLITVLKKTLL